MISEKGYTNLRISASIASIKAKVHDQTDKMESTLSGIKSFFFTFILRNYPYINPDTFYVEIKSYCPGATAWLLLFSISTCLAVTPVHFKTQSMLSILILIFAFAMPETTPANTSHTNQTNMKVAVWDTYVKRKDGKIMHFDIIAPEAMKDTAVIHGYGKEYLKTKGQAGQPLTSKECRFCHVRSLQAQWEADIRKKGYFILEMENCN